MIKTMRLPGDDEGMEIDENAQRRIQATMSAIGWLSRVPEPTGDIPYTNGILIEHPVLIGGEEFYPVGIYSMPEGKDGEGFLVKLFFVPSVEMTDEEIDAIILITEDIATMAKQYISYGEEE